MGPDEQEPPLRALQRRAQPQTPGSQVPKSRDVDRERVGPLQARRQRREGPGGPPRTVEHVLHGVPKARLPETAQPCPSPLRCSLACGGWVLTQGAGTPALTALLSGLQATLSPLLPARSLCSRHIGRMGIFTPLKDEATEARAGLRHASASQGAGDGAQFPDVQPGPFPRRRPVAALSGLEAWLLLIFLQGGHAHLHLWLLSWP